MRTFRRRPLTAASVVAVVTAGTLSAAAFVGSGSALAAGTGSRPAPVRHASARGHGALPTPGQGTGSMLERRIRGSVTADVAATSTRSTRLPVRGTVRVMLELDVAPTSSAYAGSLSRGRRPAVLAARAQRGRVLAIQRQVQAALGRRATRARTLFRTSSVYSGVAVSTDASRLGALGALPGVRAVHLLRPKRMANSSTVPLIGAPASWSSAGTGTGVRIGIIDSGIDYTHADFGGPGTAAAYDAARATSAQPPSYPVDGNVMGGIDLAGDAYDPDATLADGSPDPARAQPQPDANPLDCEGHGTHVAGSAAGLGVTPGGQTYRGPWRRGLTAADVRVGPGVAPGALLYAIKVFGCEGSTDLVTKALDWAADPNGDGDVGDHLDVVNMSLGGDFASPLDPDSVASDNLARLGTVVVAAAGNAGDLQDAAGSPGNATRAIAVAASDDAVAIVDGLRVDAPSGLEPSPPLDGSTDNVFGAEQSSGDPGSGVAPYDWAGRGGVSATSLVSIGSWSSDVGPSNNADGCDPYSPADAAAVAGKVAFLRWTDVGDRRCGSGARGAKAYDAGAVGVVLGDDVNSFTAGIAGDPRLPMMLVVRQGTDALKQAVDASGNDGSVKVSLTDDYQARVRLDLTGTPGDPTDRVAAFSSRGFGTSRTVKPDVTAPGVTVFSAAMGTGADGISESGTSMASPHVAGVAALVRAAHPTWTVEQVKAAIIDTAGARVLPETGGSAPEGPARVGAGRVQAYRAVGVSTLVYGADGTGAVSLSFGDVAVTSNATLTRGLRIQNTSYVGQTYAVSYRPRVQTPGVEFTVAPASVSVAARASGRVVVTMHLTAAAMRRTLDPTLSAEDGLRSYYADAGGAVLVTGDGTALTVPVYAAPRPASAMSSAPLAVVGAGGNGALDLVGKDLLQGSGAEPLDDPTAYASSVTALMLQASSPRRPDCSSTVVLACTEFADDRSADLRYVGAASDIPYTRDAFNSVDGADSGFAYFGVTAFGPWRTPASYAEYDVYIDTDAGAASPTPEPELLLFNSRLAPDSDIMVATLGDLNTGKIIDQEPLNGAVGSLDTGLFHSDSMVLPLWLPALLPYLPKRSDGTLASARLGYWVQTGTVESGLTDAVGAQGSPLHIDLRAPALRAAGDASGPSLNDDAPGRAFRLGVHRDLRTVADQAPLGLLLIHHQNLNGSRAQVVQVRGASSVALTTTATTYAYGGRPVLRATVRQASPTPTVASGTVTFRDGTRVLGRAPLVRGTALLRPPPLTRGAHTVTATFEGNALYAPARSAGVRLTVVGLRSTTTLAASSTSYRLGRRVTLTATVRPVPASGTATFREGSRVIGRVAVVRGAAAVRTPVLGRGRHLVRATYDGSGTLAPSTSATLTLRVW